MWWLLFINLVCVLWVSSLQILDFIIKFVFSLPFLLNILFKYPWLTISVLASPWVSRFKSNFWISGKVDWLRIHRKLLIFVVWLSNTICRREYSLTLILSIVLYFGLRIFFKLEITFVNWIYWSTQSMIVEWLVPMLFYRSSSSETIECLIHFIISFQMQIKFIPFVFICRPDSWTWL